MNPAAIVDAQHPWPGLIAFNEGAQSFFHGRDAAEVDLARMIRTNTSVLLFGRSGLGKTSLLQAGVFPRLRDHGFLPVLIRLQHQQGAPDPIAQVAARLAETLEESGIEHGRLTASSSDDLWGWLHRRDFDPRRAGEPIVPVLVFDQFEELFTLGSRGAERTRFNDQLLDALADLFENRLPADLRDRIEADPSLLAEYDLEQASYRVVIALREDFLPFLETLRRRSPSFGDHRYRLLPMTQADALAAIELPGREVVTREVARSIVVSLANIGAGGRPGSDEVDPAILSLFCRELNEHRLARGAALIDADIIMLERDRIFEEFYENSFKGLDPRIRAFVEDVLVSDQGNRDSSTLERAFRALPGATQDLDALIARRILRREERDTGPLIELVHDALLRPALKGREQRAFLLKQQRRRAEVRRRLVTAVALTVLLCMTATFAYWVFDLGRRGERERALAEQSVQRCTIELLSPSIQQKASLDFLPTLSDGIRSASALSATPPGDCVEQLPALLVRAEKKPGDALAFATTLSALPSSEEWRPRILRIDAVVRKFGEDTLRRDFADELATARRVQSRTLLAAGRLPEAAATLKLAIDIVSKQTDGRDPRQLADLMSELGEIHLQAGDGVTAEPVLLQALSMRNQLLEHAIGARSDAIRSARRNLARTHADLGRAKLLQIRVRPPAQREGLMELSRRHYRSCRSSSAGTRGLPPRSEEWSWIVSRCYIHQAKSLQSIDRDAARLAFRSMLGISDIDLQKVPQAEKQEYYDVLDALADYHQEVMLQKPDDEYARRMSSTYRRWLMIAQRDTLGQNFNLQHRDALVSTLLDLAHLQQLLGQSKDALRHSDFANLLDSGSPRAKRVRGTAVLVEQKNRCLAENLFREAAVLDGQSQNLTALRRDFAELAVMGVADFGGKAMLALLSTPDPGPGERASCIQDAPVSEPAQLIPVLAKAS